MQVAVCVNCKFWDDKAPFFRQNSRISAATGIPLADFNAMEMAFLRGLGWNICMGPEDFDHWSRVIEDCAEAQRKETEERREVGPSGYIYIKFRYMYTYVDIYFYIYIHV